MNVYIVLFGSTVIFAAVVSYDDYSFHDVLIVCVYVYKYVCTEGRKVE